MTVRKQLSALSETPITCSDGRTNLAFNDGYIDDLPFTARVDGKSEKCVVIHIEAKTPHGGVNARSRRCDGSLPLHPGIPAVSERHTLSLMPALRLLRTSPQRHGSVGFSPFDSPLLLECNILRKRRSIRLVYGSSTVWAMLPPPSSGVTEDRTCGHIDMQAPRLHICPLVNVIRWTRS
jgi:hypothetical protein